MKKKKNTPQKSTVFWEKIKYICAAVIFIAGLFIIVDNIIVKIKVKHNTKTVIGWIYDKGTFRQTIDLRHYYFFIGDERYNGMCYFREKGIGDTIRIYYYPDDPDINRSWKDYYEIIKEN